MKLKSAFVWLASVVVGLSLGQAQAATLMVDDFSNLGTVPATNQWGNASAAGVLGGTRNFTKVGGTAQKWLTPSSTPTPSPPVPAGTLRLESNGSTNTASNQFQFMYNGSPTSSTPTLNPKVNVSSMTYLNVVGQFATNASTQAIVRLTSGSGSVSAVTVTQAGYDSTNKVWRFALSGFSPLNKSQLQRVYVQFNALGVVNNIDKIYFSDYYVPEPSTFALAGLAAVGLVIARRKKK